MIEFKIEDSSLNFEISESGLEFKTDAEYISSGTSFQTPYSFDYGHGYVAAGNGLWTAQWSPENNQNDIYTIKNGHLYVIFLGETVGNRFRVATLPSNPTATTSNIQGTNIKSVNDPPAWSSATFSAVYDGYLAVTKDNVTTKGIKSYLLDLTEAIQ